VTMVKELAKRFKLLLGRRGKTSAHFSSGRRAVEARTAFWADVQRA